jgi:protein SCO1/2
MSSRLLSLLIAVLVTGIIALALFWQPEMPTTAGPAGAPPGGDFVLTSADGPVDTATMRGKLLLIYFGYTYCPDICPTSLATTSQALGKLAPEELAQVRTIFVSVDPQRDTPARLKDYVTFFHPSMVGVTGSAAEIDAAARQYGAAYARQDTTSSAGYVVDHSAWTYIVDADGRLVDRIPHGASVDQTLAEIRKWLPSPSRSKGTS